MKYHQTRRRQSETPFESFRRTKVAPCSRHSRHLFRTVPWENRRLYVITATEALAQADAYVAYAVAAAQTAYTAAESAIDLAYSSALESANNAYTTALNSTATTYSTTITPSLTNFQETFNSLTCLFNQAIATIDNDTAIGNNYFDNATEDAYSGPGKTGARIVEAFGLKRRQKMIK